MFENVIKFFKNLGKKEKTKESSDTAKERLHLVLMQDRANVSADFLELMKQEIIEVIKKYIDVDEKSIDVRLTNKTNDDGTVGAPALYANIPIVTIKNEARVANVPQNKEKTSNSENKENRQENEKKQEELAKSKENTKTEKNDEIEKNTKPQENKKIDENSKTETNEKTEENKKAEKPEKVIEEAQKIQDKLEETKKEEISKEGIENKEEVNNVNENA